jgi:hypothetical protein
MSLSSVIILRNLATSRLSVQTVEDVTYTEEVCGDT